MTEKISIFNERTRRKTPGAYPYSWDKSGDFSNTKETDQ